MTRPPILIVLLAALLAATAAQAQDKPPLAKIGIVDPCIRLVLKGPVEFRVKATTPQGARAPGALHVGLGGPPWVPMTQVGDTDEWTATLDTTLVPNGMQTLSVITDNKKVRASAQFAVDNPLRVFFAGLHSHTCYSDGTLLPVAAHQYARDVAKLDVFSLTDHLEHVDDAEWLDTREVAWDFNEDGKFVVIPGLEWTKKWGHLNIFDPKTRRWPVDPAEFYAAIATADVVAKFNHPGDGTKSHAGLAYSEVGDKAVQLIELRSDKEEPAFIRALDNGWHVAPEGSDDTHSPNWGDCGTWTGIVAPGLSKRNVLDALMHRRVYSTRDRNCVLAFSVNGAPMGSIVAEPVQTVEILVKVEDPDARDAVAKIELYEDGEVVETDEPNAVGREWKVTRTPAQGEHYYFAKVTQADGDLLWSAPVWVTMATAEK